MYMPYSKNPHLPKVRMQAVNCVMSGWSIRKTARHFGVFPSTISRWMKRDQNHGLRPIPTRSSRPQSHPAQLDEKIVEKIVSVRKAHDRCVVVVHQELENLGIQVSLSSVQRTLDLKGLLRKRSPWKRWHFTIPRPNPENAGDLVQMDTIHVCVSKNLTLYIYTLIDVYPRWAHAKVVMRINTRQSLRFAKEAQRLAPFAFKTIQTDHGSEFSTWFSENLGVLGIAHRHSRVRQPNDNAHIERFNRTLQEECLDLVRKDLFIFKKAMRAYLEYYNGRRLHMGINLRFPLQVLRRY